MSPSCERRRVSYTVSDSMVCIRRERVQVPCAELARRIERTDSLGDRLTVQQFTPTTTRQGTVKLAFVERAGTRDRDLSSSQAAIVTASQMRKERPRSSR